MDFSYQQDVDTNASREIISSLNYQGPTSLYSYNTGGIIFDITHQEIYKS